MTNTSWTLFNIKFLAKRNRRYFPPSLDELFPVLKPGNYVQLIFRTTKNKPGFIGIEKMWCEVTGFRDGGYLGKVINIPQVIRDLKFGDEVFFYPDYVNSCCKREKMDRLFEVFKPTRTKCIVSKDIAKGLDTPRFFYREMPYSNNDSGWRLMSSKEELSLFPNIFTAVDFDTLSIPLKLMDRDIGSYFEWKGKKSAVIPLPEVRATKMAR